MESRRRDPSGLRGILGVSLIIGAALLFGAGTEIFDQFQISVFSTAVIAASICLMAWSGIIHLKD